MLYLRPGRKFDSNIGDALKRISGIMCNTIKATAVRTVRGTSAI